MIKNTLMFGIILIFAPFFSILSVLLFGKILYNKRRIAFPKLENIIADLTIESFTFTLITRKNYISANELIAGVNHGKEIIIPKSAQLFDSHDHIHYKINTDDTITFPITLHNETDKIEVYTHYIIAELTDNDNVNKFKKVKILLWHNSPSKIRFYKECFNTSFSAMNNNPFSESDFTELVEQIKASILYEAEQLLKL